MEEKHIDSGSIRPFHSWREMKPCFIKVIGLLYETNFTKATFLSAENKEVASFSSFKCTLSLLGVVLFLNTECIYFVA